jgi:hypothetical protein
MTRSLLSTRLAAGSIMVDGWKGLAKAWIAHGAPPAGWLLLSGTTAYVCDVVKWASWLLLIYIHVGATPLNEILLEAVQHCAKHWGIGPASCTVLGYWSQVVVDCIRILMRRLAKMARSKTVSKYKLVESLKFYRRASLEEQLKLQSRDFLTCASCSDLAELQDDTEPSVAGTEPMCTPMKAVRKPPPDLTPATKLPELRTDTEAVIAVCSAAHQRVDVMRLQQAACRKEKKPTKEKFVWGEIQKEVYKKAKQRFMNKATKEIEKMALARDANKMTIKAACTQSWFNSAAFEEALQGMPLHERKRRRFCHEEEQE